MPITRIQGQNIANSSISTNKVDSVFTATYATYASVAANLTPRIIRPRRPVRARAKWRSVQSSTRQDWLMRRMRWQCQQPDVWRPAHWLQLRPNHLETLQHQGQDIGRNPQIGSVMTPTEILLVASLGLSLAYASVVRAQRHRMNIIIQAILTDERKYKELRALYMAAQPKELTWPPPFA